MSTLTAEADLFVSTCNVFNCLFLPNVQIEIQLLSRVFCYSWLVCLFGFWLRNTSLSQSRKSDLGWHRFRFPPCLIRKTVEKSEAIWPYLIVFSAYRMISLSNYCIWCLFFISNLMKSSVVCVAIWFLHVCNIWDNDLTEYQVWFLEL